LSNKKTHRPCPVITSRPIDLYSLDRRALLVTVEIRNALVNNYVNNVR